MSRKILDLLSALRLAGRRFDAGRPTDLISVRRLIDWERKNFPVVCGELTDLIQKAEDAATLGDRTAAMKHYRAAIDLWNRSL